MAQVPDPLLFTVRTTPKDAQVIEAIMKEMDFDDFEPRVINQLLEFTNRYACNIIEEARMYANHAGRSKTIDARDVDLAIRLQHDKNFSSVPDRELTVELARSRNSVSLPLIKSSAGLRLPPDRYNLTACNYRLKSASKKPRAVHTVSRHNVASTNANSASKGSPSITSFNKAGTVTPTTPTPVSGKPSSTISTPVTKAATNAVKPVMTPTKFSEAIKPTTTMPTLPTITSIVSAPATEVTTTPQMLIPSISSIAADMTRTMAVKRERDEDDDYDMK